MSIWSVKKDTLCLFKSNKLCWSNEEKPAERLRSVCVSIQVPRHGNFFNISDHTYWTMTYEEELSFSREILLPLDRLIYYSYLRRVVGVFSLSTLIPVNLLFMVWFRFCLPSEGFFFNLWIYFIYYFWSSIFQVFFESFVIDFIASG